MSLKSIVSRVEEELSRNAQGEAIILEEYNSFKATLDSSLGVKVSAKAARAAYKAAKHTITELENNFKKKDPLRHSIVKNSTPETYYAVGSGQYAARKLKKVIDESLTASGVLEGRSYIPIESAQVDASSVRHIRTATAAYNEILTAKGSFKAKASIVVTLYQSLPDSITRQLFLKHIKQNPTAMYQHYSSLHNKLASYLVAEIDPKKTPKNQRSGKTTTSYNSRGSARVRKSTNFQGLVINKSVSPLKLINAINKQLPSKIRANMGTPRLNWRTGRFGTSVKVTSIERTTDNAGRITYSYMGYPYSIFELGSGSKLATAHRDPRRLIDLTIRDIAKSLTNAKFATRRTFS